MNTVNSLVFEMSNQFFTLFKTLRPISRGGSKSFFLFFDLFTSERFITAEKLNCSICLSLIRLISLIINNNKSSVKFYVFTASVSC